MARRNIGKWQQNDNDNVDKVRKIMKAMPMRNMMMMRRVAMRKVRMMMMIMMIMSDDEEEDDGNHPFPISNITFQKMLSH